MRFVDAIRKMNTMYELPIKDKPTAPDAGEFVTRLLQFKDILKEEYDEINEIIDGLAAAKLPEPSSDVTELTPEQAIVKLADLLGDIIVYCRSEAMRFGIPLEDVLEVIMESNFSKLDLNGKPIKDERGKFLKGPRYWAPEPAITALLQSRGLGFDGQEKIVALNMEEVEKTAKDQLQLQAQLMQDINTIAGLPVPARDSDNRPV